MVDRTVTTRINPDYCVGCGECIRVCPSQTIELIEGKAVVTGDRSLGCGHCKAVCPSGAIRIPSLENDALDFQTFSSGHAWLRHGDADLGQLVRLMRSRRSCRNYTAEPVSRDMLEDLVKIGVTAPSGSNAQRWCFTILDNRAAVEKLVKAVSGFFKKVIRLSEKAWLRKLFKLAGKPELDQFYREYHASVGQALQEYEEEGKDPLFHGAPAVIIISARPGASCPAEDAILAAGNILLAAHAMGLGSCLIGFAVEAFKKAPQLKEDAAIPPRERVYAVIALGHPNEKYQGLPGRKKYLLRHAG